MHLFKWKARRAGGRITVVGKTEDGADAKIVGVDVIMPAPGAEMVCHAIDRNGETHKLAF